MTTCPGCGAEVSESAKSCPECGRRLKVELDDIKKMRVGPPPSLIRREDERLQREPERVEGCMGVRWRVVPIILDGLILLAVGYVIALATGNTAEDGFGFEFTGVVALLYILLAFAYYIAMEAIIGATVGKLLLGLRVVKSNWSPIGWRAAAIRNILRIVDGFFFYAVGAIVMCLNARRQRLGDLAAGTVVTRARDLPQLLRERSESE